jgi:hypothetical protein
MKKISSYIPTLLLCACAPTVAPTSCNASDTFVGDGGILNFSTIVDYQEENFSAPGVNVGVGLAFPIALIEKDDGVNGTLEAEAVGFTVNVAAQNAGTSRILPFGAAQFILFFDAPDVYEVQAIGQDGIVDVLTINAVDVDHIRLANGVTITTDGEECDTSISITPLDPSQSVDQIISEQTLHTNQTIEIAFVPADVNDGALFGLLDLQGASENVQVTAFPFSNGVPANSFSLRSTEQSNGAVNANFDIIENNTTLTVNFQAVQEEEIPVCQ